MKQMGARNAGNPHVACDVEGAGNAARSRYLGLDRRASPRPYLGERGGAIPPRHLLAALTARHRCSKRQGITLDRSTLSAWGGASVLVADAAL